MFFDLSFAEQYLAFIYMKYINRSDLINGVMLSWVLLLVFCIVIAKYKQHKHAILIFPSNDNAAPVIY